MTTNTNRCNDCHRVTTKANTKIYRCDDLCDDCYELAGLEAEHQDGAHDDAPHAECLLCDPNARKDRSKPSNDVKPHTARSHAVCYAQGRHEPTREGRAQCRAEGGPKA